MAVCLNEVMTEAPYRVKWISQMSALYRYFHDMWSCSVSTITIWGYKLIYSMYLISKEEGQMDLHMMKHV